jgi:hypothetical protein
MLGWMSWEPSERRGDQLRGVCPLCSQLAASYESNSAAVTQSSIGDGGKTLIDRRCFSVNIRRNIFHCFRCKRGGDVLNLWSYHRAVPIHAAALEIRDRLPPTAAKNSSIQQLLNRNPPAS